MSRISVGVPTVRIPSAAATFSALSGVTGFVSRAYRLPFAAGGGGASGFQVRLQIGESAAAAPADFAVAAGSFPSGENAGGDFYFCRPDGTAVPFYVERVTGTAPNRTARVWLALPNGTTADTVFLLTESRTAQVNRSNPNAVFPSLFDSFDGSALDASRWTGIDTTGVTVGSGSMRHTSSSGRLRSVATFNDNVGVVETLVRIAARSVNGHVPLGLVSPSAPTVDALAYLSHPNNDFLRVDGGWSALTSLLPLNTEILFSLTVADLGFLGDLVTAAAVNYDTGASLAATSALKTVSGEAVYIGRRPDSDVFVGQAGDYLWRWVRIRQAGTPPTLGVVTEV